MIFVYIVVSAILGYLIGAVPVGVIVAKANKIDIHSLGSGKMGTTNVLRSVGKRAALIVLVGDVLKGVVAVLAARILASWVDLPGGHIEFAGISITATTLLTLVAALAAVTGHVWSIYMRILYGKWYGGRGVATSMGAVLVINPLILLIAGVVAVPIILLSRYVSLGSIVGAIVGGIVLIALIFAGQMEGLAILYLILPIIIIVAHRDNIARLLNGTERKLGERTKYERQSGQA